MRRVRHFFLAAIDRGVGLYVVAFASARAFAHDRNEFEGAICLPFLIYGVGNILFYGTRAAHLLVFGNGVRNRG